MRSRHLTITLHSCFITGDLSTKWHGIGGRTISKLIRHDLGVVETFAPEIIVNQLGTNHLSFLSTVETGSALEELSRLLHESYDLPRVCVYQTTFRGNAPLINRQVMLLTNISK